MKSFFLNIAYLCSLGFLVYNIFYVENPTNHQVIECIFCAMVIMICSLERATFLETVIIEKEDEREEYKGNKEDNE